MSEVRGCIGLHEDGLEIVGRFVALRALVVDQVSRRLFLIERQILGCLGHGHAELVDDVGTVDPALPKEAEFYELQPFFDTPAHGRSSLSR